MNKIIVMGRLTKDPETVATQSGTSLARYTVAVDRKYKKEGSQSTDFFNCTSFGKQADFVAKYLKKGVKVVISGEMLLDVVEKDGRKTTYPKISVEDVEFAESKATATASPQNTTESDFLNVPDNLVEELPFS